VGSGGFRLGVDFGTSNTVAILAGPDGRIRPLLFDGSPLLASAVFAGPDSELLVGADAIRAAVGYPAGLEPNPKRLVDDGTAWLGEREYPVVDLVAAVLGRVEAEATRVVGGVPDEVVLTHPATWRLSRLDLLADAARRAGLGEARFVAEPVAAAAYFAAVLDRPVAAGQCIVVYDLGAGTFDAALVRPGPDGFDVLAAAGLSDVGGLDLDAAVVRHARALTASSGEAWQRLDWPRQPADRHARQSLWQAARNVKEQLSRHSTGDLFLPLVDRQIHLTRDEFEQAVEPLLDRTSSLTRQLLAEAGVPPENISGVFLVGGSSRIPLAATLLHRALRIVPTVIDQPELVVAEGALHIRSTTAGPITGRADVADFEATPARAVPDGPFSSPLSPLPTGSAAGSEDATAVPATPRPSRPATFQRMYRTDRPRRRLVRVGAGIVAGVALIAAVVLAIRPWPSGITAGGRLGDRPVAEQVGDLLRGHTQAINGLALSPDGKTIATTSFDNTVRLWDLASRQPIGTLRPGSSGSAVFTNDVAFSPDGKILATTGENDKVRLWDVTGQHLIGELAGHTAVVEAVAFSSDGNTVASVGRDKTVRLWDLAGRRQIAELTGHTGNVDSLAFSPNGEILATGGSDGEVRLWNVDGHRSIGEPLTGHTDEVAGMAFSPDGRILATASYDRTVRLWEVASHRLIGNQLTGHGDHQIDAVAFSPDGRTLATGGWDQTVLLWNVSSHRPIGRPLLNVRGELAFSPDGTTLVTVAGNDNAIALWRLAT
jgi:sugar lactone lactonase YvrE